MKCSKCGKDMWDNKSKNGYYENKYPRQPDYKCKDKACSNAVWDNDKKSTGEKKEEVKRVSSYEERPIPKSMYVAWAKDIVLACNKELTQEKALELLPKVIEDIGNIVNSQTEENHQVKKEETAVEEQGTTVTEEVVDVSNELDLGDLDIDI